jgi:hypothetical protein
MDKAGIEVLMTRRKTPLRILLWAGTGAVFAVLIFYAVARWSQPEDPLYAGTPLSEHLITLYGNAPGLRGPALTFSNRPNSIAIAAWRADSAKRNAARKALSSAPPGPEAIPLITNWLATKPVEWKLKLGERLRGYNADYLNLSFDRRAIAWNFLSDFSIGAANELLPYVEAAIHSTNQVGLYRIAAAFNRNMQGAENVKVEEALRALMLLNYALKRSPVDTGLQYSSIYWNANIDGCIETLDPQRMLRPLFVLELGPEAERVGAAIELTQTPRMHSRAVPLLIRNLSSTNRSVQEQCANALSQYGKEAKVALPALSKLLGHPRERIRLAASNSIAAITAVDKSEDAEGFKSGKRR